MKHLFLFIFCVCSFTSLLGMNEITFKHLGVNDGLSDSQVNHITKDSKGFMWFSTGYGLNRYDGYTFKVFTRNSKDPYSLAENAVDNVQEGIDGLLWIHTVRSGYFYYDPRKETFHPVMPLLKDKYGIPNPPQLIYIDKEKNFWINNYDGLFFYDITKQKLTHYPVDEKVSKKGSYISCITEDKNNILLLYNDGYFESIDRQTAKIVDRNDYLLHAMSVIPSGVYKMFVDADEDYWIYADAGVWVYHTSEGRWEYLNSQANSPIILSSDIVRDIKNDTKNQIWIATDHGGINVINKKNRSIQYLKNNVLDERSIIQNSINSLYCDDNGGVWVGSYKRGISYYNESVFKFRNDHFPEFSQIRNFTADVNSVVEDRHGNLWVGTSSGLVYMNRTTNERKLYQHITSMNSLSSDVVVGQLHTKDGKIWIGTYRGGLCVFDGHAFTCYKHDPERLNSLASDNIWTLAEGKDGYIWIGTLGCGLQGLDPRTGKFTRYAQQGSIFEKEYITSIRVGRDENIYMATTNGLTIYSPSTRTFEKRMGNKRGTEMFSHSNLNDIYEDSRGLLWIATAEGLNIYDPKNDEVFVPIKNFSLGNEIIQAIVEDNNKNMWITTNISISNIVVNVDPTTGVYIYVCHSYDELDGLQGQQFNARSITRTKKGEIIAGGVQGISLFDPEGLRYNSVTPKIEFTGLQLFNEEVKIDSVYDGNCILTQTLNQTSEIKLKYSQNVFSVSFSAMNYILPEKTKYMYMLEGFNMDWMTADVNKLTYTNLAPGTYTLRVKAINSDGFSNHETAELRIVITPPFWASPLAYAFYLFLIAVILYWARGQVLRNERQKFKLVQIEQEALQKHEVDDMKLRFFTNISHELRTPLTLIISPLENVIKHIENNEQKNKLEMVHRNALRLLNLVNQLLDFRRSDVKGHQLNPSQGDIVEYIRNVSNSFIEYSEKKNIHLIFFSTIENLWMVFDEDKVGKIIMNLLSNAFKFTPEGGRVDVSLDILPAEGDCSEQLEIKISDTGVGIADADKELIFERFYQIQPKEWQKSCGSGIGLHLVKEFVSLHGGTVTILDNVVKGSVFIVILPVVRSQEQEEQEKKAVMNQEVVEMNLQESLNEITDEEETENAGSKQPVVLIVDDSNDFRLFMRDSLQAEYIVEEASDGNKAWKIIPELHPDIIVSDVMMPGMDGNELCRLVKTDIRTSHIPLILLTARSAKEQKLEGLESGADDYITKPFDFDLLTIRIRNLLQLRQKRQENFKQLIEVSPSEITITSLDEKLINKAVRYVENNIFRSELSVEELSSELGMSRVCLYKKMLSITGKTPIEFIRIIRLKRAAQYLRESQQSVSEIAYQTGFSNPKYFRKYFKEEFGILPSEYQAREGV